MLDLQQYINSPTIDYTQIDTTTSSFEIKYLPRGFGHTLGNAFRRIIVGYNYGSAVTALKIKWASHEYAVIEWVKDSVMDMLLSIKALRFKTDELTPRSQWVSQKFKGIGVYTSANLSLPDGLVCLNDNQYLFEITDSATELYIEMRVEKWYGYYSMEYLRAREEKADDTDTNLLLIDNDFSCVTQCAYEVEEVIEDFIGNMKDKLTITVSTISPQFSPKDVLAFAGEVLASYARLFIFPDAFVDKSVLIDHMDIQNHHGVVATHGVDASIKTQPIEILGLSERTRNALLKNNILFVEDLEKKKRNELISMRGVGKKAVDEIEDALNSIGKWLLA
jgi:DNA-directed RNA polymerase subunit alpha